MRVCSSRRDDVPKNEGQEVTGGLRTGPQTLGKAHHSGPRGLPLFTKIKC